MDKENQTEIFEEEYGFIYGDERLEMDDTPDHDDIVGWETDDKYAELGPFENGGIYMDGDNWQDECEYEDYEPSPYDGTYWWHWED